MATVQTTTRQTCKHCGKKTNRLEGLFVPHACHDCMEEIRQKCIDINDICTLCGKPRCDCYC